MRKYKIKFALRNGKFKTVTLYSKSEDDARMEARQMVKLETRNCLQVKEVS